MNVAPTELPGVFLFTPRRHSDDRGHVCETWDERTLAAVGHPGSFTTDVESLSRRVGTLRGLHLQAGDHPTAKIVRCAAGALLDVVVDARPTSPTFRRWIAIELSAANGRQVCIPTGCLHGFVTTAPDTLTLYKMSAPYDPTAQVAVRWNDPALGIDWGTTGPLLSDRDAGAPLFHEAYP